METCTDPDTRLYSVEIAFGYVLWFEKKQDSLIDTDRHTGQEDTDTYTQIKRIQIDTTMERG